MWAYVDLDRQLVWSDPDGTAHTLSRPVTPFAQWQQAEPTDLLAWPCFSPDGTRLAAFRVPLNDPSAATSTLASEHLPQAAQVAEDSLPDVADLPDLPTDAGPLVRRLAQSPARVCVFSLVGGEDAELAHTTHRVPIYLGWSNDSQHVAWLDQGRSSLRLTTSPSDRPDAATQVAEGTPLFFSWEGGGLWTYAGGHDADGGPSVRRYTASGRFDRALPGAASSFCTPIPIGPDLDRRIAYVVAPDEQSAERQLVLSPATEGLPPHPLASMTGLVAMVTTPDGSDLAWAHSPEGDATPYLNLSVARQDRASHPPPPAGLGPHRVIYPGPSVAFFWRPDGQALIVFAPDPGPASEDEERPPGQSAPALIVWQVFPDGRRQDLGRYRPSREMSFYLRYFEQYTISHPLVDPDSQALLLVGWLDEEVDAPGPPRAHRVRLDGSGSTPLAPAVFAVYPQRAATN